MHATQLSLTCLWNTYVGSSHQCIYSLQVDSVKKGKTLYNEGENLVLAEFNGFIGRKCNPHKIKGNRYRSYTSKMDCWSVIAWVNYVWQRTFESTAFVRLDRISISLE